MAVPLAEGLPAGWCAADTAGLLECLQRLAENGGTPECEDAVVNALRYLKKSQGKDGSWGSKNVAYTGLALIPDARLAVDLARPVGLLDPLVGIAHVLLSPFFAGGNVVIAPATETEYDGSSARRDSALETEAC